MTLRWRRRLSVVAISIACLLLLSTSASAERPDAPRLRLALPDGTTLATVTLPADGSFALRYRNSLYGTLAEERFVVTDRGELRVVELAADQLAVLEEYYAITSPARLALEADGRAWTASPAHVPEITRLQIAATDRGERTLLVAGQPSIELSRFVEDASPTVILELDR
jgi:hypothetical protein